MPERWSAGRDRRRRCGGRWCRGRRHRRARRSWSSGGRARRRGGSRGIAAVGGPVDRDHDAQSDQHEHRRRHPPPTLVRRPRDRGLVGWPGRGRGRGDRLARRRHQRREARRHLGASEQHGAHRAGRREAVRRVASPWLSTPRTRDRGARPARAARTSGTADCWWAIAIASAESPSNGGRPASIS